MYEEEEEEQDFSTGECGLSHKSIDIDAALLGSNGFRGVHHGEGEDESLTMRSVGPTASLGMGGLTISDASFRSAGSEEFSVSSKSNTQYDDSMAYFGAHKHTQKADRYEPAMGSMMLQNGIFSDLDLSKSDEFSSEDQPVLNKDMFAGGAETCFSCSGSSLQSVQNDLMGHLSTSKAHCKSVHPWQIDGTVYVNHHPVRFSVFICKPSDPAQDASSTFTAAMTRTQGNVLDFLRFFSTIRQQFAPEDAEPQWWLIGQSACSPSSSSPGNGFSSFGNGLHAGAADMTDEQMASCLRLLNISNSGSGGSAPPQLRMESARDLARWCEHSAHNRLLFLRCAEGGGVQGLWTMLRDTAAEVQCCALAMLLQMAQSSSGGLVDGHDFSEFVDVLKQLATCADNPEMRRLSQEALLLLDHSPHTNEGA